eukprot:TRINITY_DN47650_c0_g1_i1.p1 TRINITY_DN47650_c0_g1~~TRINITY_DN47650_c0_g1_i1.p1  ORF type:complete len:143 (+),score=27.00 TRINITY_DN47650_c0_g1_i1:79-507(+)
MGQTFMKSLNMGCGAANAITGVVTAVMWLEDIHPPQAVLTVYMALFGILQVMAQFKTEDGERMSFAFMRSSFGILGTYFGLGVFLLFVGSLGISFGHDDGVKHWLPFICGCVTVGVALVCFVHGCMCKSESVYGNIGGASDL